MRNGILGSLAVLAVGAGMSYGQGMPPGGPPMGGPEMGLMSPDGHPIISAPGMDGFVPPGAMGSGGPGNPWGTGGGGILNGLNRGGPRRIWFGAEYLYWVPRSMDVQYPLATTSTGADLGVLGRATTASLLGAGSDITYGSVNGIRSHLGFALGEDGWSGIEFTGMWLQNAHRRFDFRANGNGAPLLAVPFYDPTATQQGAYVVAAPNISTGNIAMHTQFHAYGAEANGILSAYRSDCDASNVEFIAGFRFFNLEETLGIRTTSTPIGVIPAAPGVGGAFFPGQAGTFAGNPLPALGTFGTNDFIRTYNDFYGLQVGARGEHGFGKFSLGLSGKVAAGYVRQWVDLEGSSVLTAAGVNTVQPGGLFNMAQELGRHRKDRFAWMPEGQVTVSCYVTPKCRIFAGYSFAWISNVLRPDSVTTSALHPTMIPVSPAFTGNAPPVIAARDIIHDTDFFLHGLTVGVSLGF